MPTLKEKNRYLVYRVTSKEKFKFEDIKKTMYDTIKDFIGDLGIAKAGLNIMPETFVEDKQTGIIKTNHKNVDLIKSAIMFVKEIKGKKAKIETKYVSGTIKKAKAQIGDAA